MSLPDFTRFSFDNVDDAIAATTDRVRRVGTETTTDCLGRVLAADVAADRDSPPTDVSALDGYAVRAAEVGPPLPVAGQCAAGDPPSMLPPATAMRIFTGAPIPAGADAVVKREDATETDRHVAFATDPITPGRHIRRRGENAAARDVIVPAGRGITPGVAAALSTVGTTEPPVRSPVRVAILTTGDEVVPPSATPMAHQIRNSNAVSIAAVLTPRRWIHLTHTNHVPDDPDTLAAAITAILPDVDAVLLAGGVSMGDHDHVPGAARAAGGEVIFHGLAIRPGKPLLSAVTPDGVAIIGLPGNPVSATVNTRRFVLPVLSAMTDLTPPPPEIVTVDDPDDKTLPLTWFRLARRTAPGHVAVLPGRGSGDVAALAASDGFVEQPANTPAADVTRFHAW